MLKRILIVDDSAKFRQAVRASLENQTGFEICGEADGTDAIEKARALKPSVLKGMMPEVPIILLTAHDDKVGKALASVVGASVVLGKEVGISKLIECAQDLFKPL
jgi:CheY-like chemotaxis protein